MIKKLTSKENIPHVFFIVIATTLLILFWKLISLDPYLGYDDKALLDPLTQVDSFAKYFAFLKNGSILDIQPVRDITYFLDLFLFRHLPFYSFHFTNFFIWILIVFYFKKIIENFYVEGVSIWHYLALALFAFFPPSLGTVAWVSARKHLLSVLFTFICTHEITKYETNADHQLNYFKITTAYFLALFSQPINILWPLWGSIYLVFRNKTTHLKRFCSLTFPFMFTVAAVNFYYYKILYLDFGLQKFMDLKFFESVHRAFLALGCYAAIIINPFSALPTPHNELAIQNTIGLIVITLIALTIVLKRDSNSLKKNSNLILIFSLYFILHIAPVLWKSNIFASDTYLINASAGILILLQLILVDKKIFRAIALLYVTSFIVFSSQYLDNFLNTKKMWAYAYQKELSPEALGGLANQILHEKKFKDVYVLTKDDSAISSPEIIHIHSISIYFNSEINRTDKLRELSKISDHHPTPNLFLALIYLRENKKAEFEQHLKNFISMSSNYSSWYSRQEKVWILVSKLCTLATEFSQSCQKQNSINNLDSLVKEKYRLQHSKLAEPDSDKIDEYILSELL